MKNKRILFDKPGNYVIEEIETESIKEDEALLKVNYCGLCTWERHIYKGLEDVQFPFIGGHEISAEIIEVGKQLKNKFALGDKVAVAKFERCNSCYYCRKRLDNHCIENFREIEEGKVWGPGGFSKYIKAKDFELYKIDNDVKIENIALAEPIACITRSQSKIDMDLGDTSVVIGAGIMGLLNVQLLKLKGHKVITLEINENRQKLAKDMGSDFVINPTEKDWVQEVKLLTENRGADNIFYTAGGIKVVNQCLDAIVVNGNVTIYAPLLVDSGEIDIDLIHYKEIKLTGSIRHDQESFRKAANIISENKLDFDSFNLEKANFNDFDEAMNLADKNKEVHRYLMEW